MFCYFSSFDMYRSPQNGNGPISDQKYSIKKKFERKKQKKILDSWKKVTHTTRKLGWNPDESTVNQ